LHENLDRSRLVIQGERVGVEAGEASEVDIGVDPAETGDRSMKCHGEKLVRLRPVEDLLNHGRFAGCLGGIPVRTDEDEKMEKGESDPMSL
jgi:hypothetical protein